MIDKSQTTLRDFFHEVYIPARMMNSKGRSIEQTDVAINRLAVFLGKDEPTLADLTEANISAWMAAGLTQEKPLAPNTINSRFREMKTLWRYAVRKRFITVGDENNLESVDRLKVLKRNPRAWAIEEMAAIICSARLAHGRYMGIKAGLWWDAFLNLLYDTGLRLSAAMGIRFDEIDFTNKLLCVPPDRMKNSCEQYFRLHDQTIESILATLPPRRKLVFPFPWKYNRSLYGRYRRILKRAGLPATNLDMFHKIRRTTASHVSRLLGEQAAIRQLGHSDASCIKRYIDPRFTNDHNAAASLPRPAWVSPKLIEVEVTAIEPTAEPLPPVSVRYSQAELRGEGNDVFQEMFEDGITGPRIARALEILGIQYWEFAEEVHLNRKYLGQILAGKMPLARKSESAIKNALGLTFGRDGEADRFGHGHGNRKGVAL
jgi:integrase